MIPVESNHSINPITSAIIYGEAWQAQPDLHLTKHYFGKHLRRGFRQNADPTEAHPKGIYSNHPASLPHELWVDAVVLMILAGNSWAQGTKKTWRVFAHGSMQRNIDLFVPRDMSLLVGKSKQTHRVPPTPTLKTLGLDSGGSASLLISG